MKELDKNELMRVDGGNVPTAYYMDNDVIKANAEIATLVAPVYAKVIGAFWQEFVKAILL